MAVVAAAGVAVSRPSKALWELRILGSRGGVGVSRRTSCCSGPPLLLDSVARVVIGAAAEQSRSAAEGTYEAKGARSHRGRHGVAGRCLALCLAWRGWRPRAGQKDRLRLGHHRPVAVLPILGLEC